MGVKEIKKQATIDAFTSLKTLLNIKDSDKNNIIKIENNIIDINDDIIIKNASAINRWKNITKAFVLLNIKIGKIRNLIIEPDKIEEVAISSLEGGPEEVKENFICEYSILESLKGGPKKVGGNYSVHGGRLKSLEGAPREVGGYFDCSNNKLQTLKDCPERVDGSFICSNNPIRNYNFHPKYVGGDFRSILHSDVDSTPLLDDRKKGEDSFVVEGGIYTNTWLDPIDYSISKRNPKLAAKEELDRIKNIKYFRQKLLEKPKKEFNYDVLYDSCVKKLNTFIKDFKATREKIIKRHPDSYSSIIDSLEKIIQDTKEELHIGGHHTKDDPDPQTLYRIKYTLNLYSAFIPEKDKKAKEIEKMDGQYFIKLGNTLKTYGIDIKNITVTRDGFVNSEKSIDLSNKNLNEIPIKFGTIWGSFDCSNNNLTTLENAPTEVHGVFDCSHNQIKEFEKGHPLNVNTLLCNDNELISLKHSPSPFEGGKLGEFNCSNNKNLTSLEGCTSKNTKYDFNASNCNLNTLEGCPSNIGGNLILTNNKNLINSLINKTYESYFENGGRYVAIPGLNLNKIEGSIKIDGGIITGESSERTIKALKDNIVQLMNKRKESFTTFNFIYALVGHLSEEKSQRITTYDLKSAIYLFSQTDVGKYTVLSEKQIFDNKNDTQIEEDDGLKYYSTITDEKDLRNYLNEFNKASVFKNAEIKNINIIKDVYKGKVKIYEKLAEPQKAKDPSEKVRQKKEKEMTWSDAEDVSKDNTSWLK